jgi:hypothetical protein
MYVLMLVFIFSPSKRDRAKCCCVCACTSIKNTLLRSGFRRSYVHVRCLHCRRIVLLTFSDSTFSQRALEMFLNDIYKTAGQHDEVCRL